MDKPFADPIIDPDVSPATRLALPRQRAAALCVVLLLTVMTSVLLPLAQLRWAMIPAFLPAYQTAVILCYLITAYLVHMQYQATRSVSLLYLSAASFYSACMLIAQFLSFPNMFVPHAQLIGGAQTTIWLWAFWHGGPAIGILFYAWAEYRHPGQIASNPQRLSIRTALTLAATLLATLLLVTGFETWLPVMDINGDYSRINRFGVAPAIQVAVAVGLLVLWKASRFRSVLHIWLGVALFALFCDNALTMAGGDRLTLGWYLGRAYGLLSAAMILGVYLREIQRSYTRSAAVAEHLINTNAELSVRVDEARNDALTHLPLRELLYERAERMRAASVAQGTGFAILFIDLDGFKSINDRFGHDHGDNILIQVANALTSVLRTGDLAGRIGGDEFVACLSAPADQIAHAAEAVATRLIERINEVDACLGASIGISTNNSSLDTAISEADAAMYRSKHAGRNRSTVFGAGQCLPGTPEQAPGFAN